MDGSVMKSYAFLLLLLFLFFDDRDVSDKLISYGNHSVQNSGCDANDSIMLAYS